MKSLRETTKQVEAVSGAVYRALHDAVDWVVDGAVPLGGAVPSGGAAYCAVYVAVDDAVYDAVRDEVKK